MEHGGQMMIPEGVPTAQVAAAAGTPVVVSAAPVLPASASAATSGPWIPVGSEDAGVKGEKCGIEYATEIEVRQALKHGSHIGYYQANGKYTARLASNFSITLPCCINR